MKELLAFLDAHEQTLLEMARTGHGCLTVHLCEGFLERPYANLSGLPELLHQALREPQGPCDTNTLRRTQTLIRKIREAALLEENTASAGIKGALK